MKFILIIISTLLLLTACSSLPQSSAKPSSPTVALVLGGGGTLGFAHVGVLQALEQENIKPDLVVGTSAGAIVGSLYASGKSANELNQLANLVSSADLLDFTARKSGVIQGIALRNFINTQTDRTPIEKLPIRFIAVATQANTGQAVAFSRGDTGQAVQASASVPKVFIAPIIDGVRYIDGASSAVVPSRIARQFGADVVIAVDLMSQESTIIPNSTIQQASSLLSMLPINTALTDKLKHIEKRILANPDDIKASDVVITPALTTFSVVGAKDRQDIIQAGFIATKSQINAIKSAITHAKTKSQQPNP
ncbi:patatin-like phospholipase family protein [Moraxella nasovis]|uniref:patatin-like phospholipase family protein n=1 Tax=Moraxella nasovis TaxID=2904121 RepID=UPI001F62022B|nr:patatin-like phospholipase family protein [Moraxella nasovis]UNU72583.1 patatin-like phospholipase family protein [Moraxella nasovis]